MTPPGDSEPVIQAILKEMSWGEDCRDDAVQLLRAIQSAATNAHSETAPRPTVDDLLDELSSLPRYGCVGPEGDYNAGMEAGAGDYVDGERVSKIAAAIRVSLALRSGTAVPFMRCELGTPRVDAIVNTGGRLLNPRRDFYSLAATYAGLLQLARQLEREAADPGEPQPGVNYAAPGQSGEASLARPGSGTAALDKGAPEASNALGAAPSIDKNYKAVGVSRMGDNDKALLVHFTRRLTDDELRDLHERLAGRALPSATREIPAELFDGMAVYVALGENSGVSPRDVAAVLDVVVRMIRKNRP